MRELRGPSSLREMAEPIGIKLQAWARYEAGGATPGGDIIAKICRAHAVSADWLLGLSDNCSGVQNNSARAGAGVVAISGNGNRVTGVVAGATTTAVCSKCPYKKKLQALEKLLAK